MELDKMEREGKGKGREKAGKRVEKSLEWKLYGMGKWEGCLYELLLLQYLCWTR
jgi:hypothetical protein